MAKLRTELLGIRNALNYIADEEKPEIDLKDVIESLNTILSKSKLGCFLAFDQIDKAEQFVLATTNSKDDTIHVHGNSTDSFDLELAFGILARARKNFPEEGMYMLFMKMMGGAYDND